MLKKNYKIQLFVFFMLLILFHSTTSAQSVILKGTVIDSLTNDPLPGANIILIGTSIGSASDVEGKFLIKNIPPGTYKVRASYVGYNSHEFKVELKEGRTFEAEFKLNPVGVEGQTVVITAQASGQNEAINQQLSSIQIKNVVSLARIQELPDANAAESVSRLPGVSIIREGGEGAKVVIRGLSPQYNQVTIDGIQLPGNVVSNDPNSQTTLAGDRATNLSMISSSMLGGIEVIKAITPDMDAAVIGGVVNFGLRKATKDNSNRPAFEVLSQGRYNALKTTYDNFMFVGSYEQRLFDESFGIFLQGSTEKRNLSANEFGAPYTLNDKQHGDAGIPDLVSLNLTDVFRTRERNAVTMVMDYDHSKGSIGFMNFFSSSNTKATSRSETISTTGSDMFYGGTDADNKLNVITNILSIKQEIPIFHVDLRLAHTYSESHNPEDLNVTFWQDESGLTGLGDLTKVSPKVLYSLAKPDASTARMNNINTSQNFSRDRTISGGLDLQTDFVVSDFLSTKVKFGGMFQHRERSYDINYGHGGNLQLGGGNTVALILKTYPNMNLYGSGIALSNFTNDSYSYGEFLKGEYEIKYPMSINLMHDILNLVRYSSNADGYNVNDEISIIYDYHGTEEKSAAYAMATFGLGENISILPGVRYQNLTTSYFAYRDERIPGKYDISDTTVTRPNGYWLPMIHAIYKPIDWLQVHFAYTNTLNYADYNAIVPRYDVTSDAIAYNNYNLKPSTSENYDLVFSIYNNEIGLLTFDGFKKRIKDLIFESKTYTTDLSKYPDLPQNRKQLYEFNTYINNPIPIDLLGIETDWQTHFWYLPDPLSGIVFNINYTHIFSEASYPKSTLDNQYDEEGNYIQTVIDTFYTTRLLNQPNDILNMALGFDYGGFSGRISLLYQNNVFKKPDFWLQNRVNSDKYVRWDLSLKQELPWYKIQVFLNLNNITGEDDTDINQKNNYPVSIERYGMTADLGLRIKL